MRLSQSDQTLKHPHTFAVFRHAWIVPQVRVISIQGLLGFGRDLWLKYLLDEVDVLAQILFTPAIVDNRTDT